MNKIIKKMKRKLSAWLLTMSRYVLIVNLGGKRVYYNCHSVPDAESWLACYDSKISAVVLDTWRNVAVAGRRAS